VQRVVGVKPVAPLRPRLRAEVKPPSPLRVRNGSFWCSCRAQRWWRFQWSLVWGRAVVLLVSMSLCFCVLCANFFALRRC